MASKICSLKILVLIVIVIVVLQFSNWFKYKKQWNFMKPEFLLDNSLVSDWTDLTDLYKIPLKMDERTKALKDIHDYIWRTLDKLQNEGNCMDKKIIRCHNPVMDGFGAAIHQHVICLHIAFALGRMFIIDHDYRGFNGLADFTKLESSKCIHLKKNLSSIKSRCNFTNKNCYLDPLIPVDINNTYRLLEYISRGFPEPKYIRSTIPQNIYTKLVSLGVKHPGHWFTAQLLGYMILRPNKEFQQKFKQEMFKLKLQRPFVAMQIRRKPIEAKSIDELKYVAKAEEYFTKHLINSTRHIFLASTDKTVYPSVVNHTNNQYKIVQYLPTKPKSSENNRDDKRKNVMEDILMDLYFISHSDYAIVTYTSNVGRLVWELKSSLFPYEERDNIHSMDVNNGYGWFGFQYKRFLFTIRDNNHAVTVGDSTVMAYKRGDSWTYMNEKTLITNGTVVKVLYVFSRVKPGVLGFVFLNDTVECRGIPLYLNDYH